MSGRPHRPMIGKHICLTGDFRDVSSDNHLVPLRGWSPPSKKSMQWTLIQRATRSGPDCIRVTTCGEGPQPRGVDADAGWQRLCYETAVLRHSLAGFEGRSRLLLRFRRACGHRISHTICRHWTARPLQAHSSLTCQPPQGTPLTCPQPQMYQWTLAGWHWSKEPQLRRPRGGGLVGPLVIFFTCYSARLLPS